MGRKIDRELVVPVLLNYIREGNSFKDSCALAGVSLRRFQEWKKADAALSASLKKAEMDCKRWHIQNIRNHAKEDWKASAWFLERKYKSEWGKEQPEVKVRQSVEVTTNHATVVPIEELHEAAKILAGLGFAIETSARETGKEPDGKS